MEKLKPLFKVLGLIAYYTKYRQSQFWDAKRIEKYQLKRIKQQIISANQTNYYQELFRINNINPFRDFNSLDDLRKIPITNKETVKKNLEKFLNKRYSSYSFKFYTSGSTGTPMLAYIHPLHWIVEQAVIFRHWKWGGYKFGDVTGTIRSYTPKENEPLIKFNKILNTYYYSPYHLTDENMVNYYNHMKLNKINVLRGYPSSIKIFANFIFRNKINDLKIKLILTASEILSSEDRSKIEGVFQTKISNHYGLAEQIVMMGDCENHSHLHNYFEYGYLELLDTEDPNIKRIIGTNLHNKTMPLLRYDTGDLALVDKTKCDCRRESIVIKNIIGRNDQAIKCPKGFDIPSVNFYTMMEYYLEIKQWQIVYSNSEFELRINSNNSLKEFEKLKIEKQLSLRLRDSGFSIRVKETSNFVQRGEGKIPAIINI